MKFTTVFAVFALLLVAAVQAIPADDIGLVDSTSAEALIAGSGKKWLRSYFG